MVVILQEVEEEAAAEEYVCGLVGGPVEGL